MLKLKALILLLISLFLLFLCSCSTKSNSSEPVPYIPKKDSVILLVDGHLYLELDKNGTLVATRIYTEPLDDDSSVVVESNNLAEDVVYGIVEQKEVHIPMDECKRLFEIAEEITQDMQDEFPFVSRAMYVEYYYNRVSLFFPVCFSYDDDILPEYIDVERIAEFMMFHSPIEIADYGYTPNYMDGAETLLD